PLFLSLRARILRHHALDPSHVPAAHRIVVVNKTATAWLHVAEGGASGEAVGVRGIHNLGEVVAALRARFPGVVLDVVNWAGMSVTEQLRLLLDTTVLVTPAGGVGMLAPFLPEGAHLVPMDYLENLDWWLLGTHSGQSVSMEAPFWNHWPHVKKHYYQVFSRDDIVPNNPGKSLDEVQFRDQTSVIVDTERLIRLIDAAFEEMDP
ncbi:hypothetical protein HK405_002244, partial [Cladochytrium tenue]